jgi:hypothetical protein
VNVDAMLECITFEQFVEWRSFYELEPFGFPSVDLFAARQMWATIAAQAGKDWRGEPTHFLVDRKTFEPEAQEVDPVQWLKQHLVPAEPVHPDPETGNHG